MAPGDDDIHSIIGANDADHARYRRILSHAFSDRALRQQEYILLHYIDLLIDRLSEKASSMNPIIDMVQWLNFTTFDIVGDLSLGKSFHCLENSRYHSWISRLFTQFKIATFLVSLRLFGPDKVFKAFLPSSILKDRAEHAGTANELIHRRLDKRDTEARRNDFMTYVLRHNDGRGMSLPEIEANFRALVIVGSETTATVLSGIITHLLRNRSAYDKLAREIRRTFAHKSEICAEHVSGLEYLNAVIEEGLRLCPPIALGMPRVVPAGDAMVSGESIPATVSAPLSSLLRISI